jgi:hypothetical protein
MGKPTLSRIGTKIRDLLELKIALAVIAGGSMLIWWIWATLDHLSGSIRGLVVFGACVFALGGALFVREFWPRRPLTEAEKRDLAIQRLQTFRARLDQIVGDFGRQSRRGPPYRRDLLLLLHEKAEVMIDSAIAAGRLHSEREAFRRETEECPDDELKACFEVSAICLRHIVDQAEWTDIREDWDGRL